MANPVRAFYFTIAASLEFLSITLPAEQTKYKTWLEGAAIGVGRYAVGARLAVAIRPCTRLAMNCHAPPHPR